MLTPQEVSNRAFSKAAFGGYNMAMVDEFLDELTDDYTALYKENAALKAKMKVLVDKVEEYRATEDSMRAALLTAQKMASTMVEEAEAKKAHLIANAEAEARNKIGALQEELLFEQKRLNTAKSATAEFISKSRAVCEAQLKLLEQLPDLTPETLPVPAEEETDAQADKRKCFPMKKRPIIAFLYDFDKTLCTTDMQDYAFIPSLGYTPGEFWGIANSFGWKNRMDGLLAYMYTMIDECRKKNIRLDRDYLVSCGRSIELFPGVKDWFARINAFGAQQGVQVEHYVLSSGLKEIIEGSGISHEFKEIYACEFLYNEDGLAYWPKLDVNFTNKTQFVYRINKGVLDIANDKDLNASMPDDSKRIPFTNMIYVGDGLSDVPCMKMMRAYGGQAVAVYQDGNRPGVEDLLAKGRVDFIFPADYSEGTMLDTTMKNIIRKMAITDLLAEENQEQLRRLGRAELPNQVELF